MNRALQTVLVSAAVLLSGAVAFGVAAAIAPPGVDHVQVVMTDRPVISVPAATTGTGPTAAATTTVPAAAAATSDATVRVSPVKPGATSSSALRSRTIVKSAVSGSRPRVVVAPAIPPTPPKVSDGDHEVVTPPVRDDDDDDDHPDDTKVTTPTPSVKIEIDTSQGSLHDSHLKGD